MTIAQVIQGRGEVWSVSADAQVSDAVDMLAQHRIGALPVSDGGSGVAGIFSERDMMRCLHKHGEAALQRPGQANGRVLPARKQDERSSSV